MKKNRPLLISFIKDFLERLRLDARMRRRASRRGSSPAPRSRIFETSRLERSRFVLDAFMRTRRDSTQLDSAYRFSRLAAFFPLSLQGRARALPTPPDHLPFPTRRRALRI